MTFLYQSLIGDAALSESGVRRARPTPAELDILRCFGWAAVQLESALFERYLRLSAARSLTTLDGFRKQLSDMEAKGYVAKVSLHGMRAFRLLLVDNDVVSAIRPQAPLDEIRLALGSVQARGKATPSDAPRVTRRLMDESEQLGSEIVQHLEQWIPVEQGASSPRRQILELLEGMQLSLAASEEAFLDYVAWHTPGLLSYMKSALSLRGPDFLLLSLRLAQSGLKR